MFVTYICFKQSTCEQEGHVIITQIACLKVVAFKENLSHYGNLDKN